jgi:hypothetical protein
MTDFKYSIGDRVLADGRPGSITGLSEPDPQNTRYLYYVTVLGGNRMLYAEHELEPMPDQGSDAVWEAMAYSYWEKWRATQDELDQLKLKIRGLIEDAFA